MGTNQHGSVRIISGSKRGSKIRFDTAPGLRPTGDRIREMLFAWMQTSVAGCGCLDMFAGSGALGFEAASRGASEVVLLEQNRSVVSVLNDNRDRLKFDNVAVQAADALQESAYKSPLLNGKQFDLIFVDPPFSEGLHQQALDLIQQLALLSSGGFVYLEAPGAATRLQIPAQWELHREKRAGDVQVQLYRAFAAN